MGNPSGGVAVLARHSTCPVVVSKAERWRYVAGERESTGGGKDRRVEGQRIAMAPQDLTGLALHRHQLPQVVRARRMRQGGALRGTVSCCLAHSSDAIGP